MPTSSYSDYFGEGTGEWYRNSAHIQSLASEALRSRKRRVRFLMPTSAIIHACRCLKRLNTIQRHPTLHRSINAIPKATDVTRPQVAALTQNTNADVSRQPTSVSDSRPVFAHKRGYIYTQHRQTWSDPLGQKYALKLAISPI